MAKGYIGTASVTGAGALAICGLVLIATTPAAIGPFGVTLWFVALLVGLASWIAVAAFVAERKLRPKASKNQLITNSVRRGLLLGGYVVVLLGLSSLQQLSIRDVLLLALFVILIEFYMVAKR
ncbi:hypothetical protein EPO04_02320 [Patescibacteria group bacterium]|nr:MAG: hypothetical protein EPO04_02320 [Patescibacteria group bacterium]